MYRGLILVGQSKYTNLRHYQLLRKLKSTVHVNGIRTRCIYKDTGLVF